MQNLFSAGSNHKLFSVIEFRLEQVIPSTCTRTYETNPYAEDCSKNTHALQTYEGIFAIDTIKLDLVLLCFFLCCIYHRVSIPLTVWKRVCSIWIIVAQDLCYFVR